jgi:hypothetical protein
MGSEVMKRNFKKAIEKQRMVMVKAAALTLKGRSATPNENSTLGTSVMTTPKITNSDCIEKRPALRTEAINIKTMPTAMHPYEYTE